MTNCKARDPENCRYHGSVRKAYEDMRNAEFIHNREIERLAALNPSDKVKYDHRVAQVEETRQAVMQAEAVYDSFDQTYKELYQVLGRAKDEVDLDMVTLLNRRIENADKLREHRRILESAGLQEPVNSFLEYDVSLRNRIEKKFQQGPSKAQVTVDTGGITVTKTSLFQSPSTVGLIYREQAEPFYFKISKNGSVKEITSGADYNRLARCVKATDADYGD